MNEVSLWIDPGQATGWSLWTHDDEHPMQRLEYGLVTGGEEAFTNWTERHLGEFRPGLVGCEWFNPHLGTSSKSKDYEAMLIQGTLIAACRALGIELIRQPLDMKALCRDSVLKDHGLFITNKQAADDPAIMWEDARDVNDTQRHALAWAKSVGHEPTLAMFWPDR